MTTKTTTKKAMRKTVNAAGASIDIESLADSLAQRKAVRRIEEKAIDACLADYRGRALMGDMAGGTWEILCAVKAAFAAERTLIGATVKAKDKVGGLPAWPTVVAWLSGVAYASIAATQ